MKQYCASPTAVVDALTAAAFLVFLVGSRSRSQVRRPKQLAPSSVPWLWQASPLVVAAWLWLLLLLQHHTSDRIGSHLTSPHPCVRAVLPPCAALTRTPRRRKREQRPPSFFTHSHHMRSLTPPASRDQTEMRPVVSRPRAAPCPGPAAGGAGDAPCTHAAANHSSEGVPYANPHCLPARLQDRQNPRMSVATRASPQATCRWPAIDRPHLLSRSPECCLNQ